MTRSDSAFSVGEDNDYDLRHEVVDSGFSRDDDRIYEEAFRVLSHWQKAKRPWKQMVKELDVADAELKRIILDDFLKVTLAHRHFQDGEPIKAIARDINTPHKVLMAARKSMLAEVENASIKAYHLSEERKKEAEAQ